MTDALYNRTTRWLTDNVTHSLPDSGSYTVDCILEKALQLVRRRGVRILVVDPLNRIDQQLEPGQTELQYITSLLNKLSPLFKKDQLTPFIIITGCLFITTVNTIVTHNLTIYMNTKS